MCLSFFPSSLDETKQYSALDREQKKLTGFWVENNQDYDMGDAYVSDSEEKVASSSSFSSPSAAAAAAADAFDEDDEETGLFYKHAPNSSSSSQQSKRSRLEPLLKRRKFDTMTTSIFEQKQGDHTSVASSVSKPTFVTSDDAFPPLDDHDDVDDDVETFDLTLTPATSTASTARTTLGMTSAESSPHLQRTSPGGTLATRRTPKMMLLKSPAVREIISPTIHANRSPVTNTAVKPAMSSPMIVADVVDDDDAVMVAPTRRRKRIRMDDDEDGEYVNHNEYDDAAAQDNQLQQESEPVYESTSKRIDQHDSEQDDRVDQTASDHYAPTKAPPADTTLHLTPTSQSIHAPRTIASNSPATSLTASKPQAIAQEAQFDGFPALDEDDDDFLE